MFKQILGNQRGMSLIEVIVASTISIIIAMGVIKINETSQQGFKSIELKSELSTSQNRVQAALMSQQKCSAQSSGGMSLTQSGPYNTWAALASDGITPPIAPHGGYTRYLVIDTLELVTGPGDGDYGTAGDNTFMTLTNGSILPGSPNWTVRDSLRLYPYHPTNNNATPNVCYLMVPVQKTTSAARSSTGGDEKNLWYELSCDIDGAGAMTSCAAAGAVAEGLLQDNGDGTWGTSEDLALNGHVYIGPTPNLTSDSYLMVAGDQPWVEVDASYNKAINLQDNQAITFGTDFDAGIGFNGAMMHSRTTGAYGVTGGTSVAIRTGTGDINIVANNGILDMYGDNLTQLRSLTNDVRIIGSENVGLQATNAQISLRAETNMLFTTNTAEMQFTPATNFNVDAGSGINLTASGSSVSINAGRGNVDINAPAANEVMVTGAQMHLNAGLFVDGPMPLEPGNLVHFLVMGGQQVLIDGSGDFVFTGGGNFTANAPNLNITSSGVATVDVGSGANMSQLRNGYVAGAMFRFNDGGNFNKPNASTIAASLTFSAPEVLAPNHYATNYFYFSDKRYKKEIETIKNASEKLSELRGVTYILRKDEFPDKHFSDGRQIGLVAQEVEAIFPELVHTAKSGYKSVKYGNLVAVLIEGFKDNLAEIKKNREMMRVMQEGIAKKDTEQDTRIEKLEAENKQLRKELNELRDEVKELHHKLDILIKK